MDIEKMRAEEKELEKLIYGETEEEVTTDTDDESHVDETFQVKDEDFDDETSGQETSHTEEQPTPSSDKQTRVSWKKRYATYKASTDQTIYDLRQTVASKNAEIVKLLDSAKEKDKDLIELKAKVAEKLDPFEGIITQEDEDLIGSEAVDIIKKVAATRQQDTSKYDELLAKVRKMEDEKTDRLRAETESFHADTMTDLKAKLTEHLPEWTEIDVDPEFMEYMKEPDSISGLSRSVHYNTAVGNRDVQRVLSFYKQFKSLKPKSKKEILAGKVTPVGGGSSATENRSDNSQKIYSIQEYTEFMDSVARGDYRGSKENRLLAKQKERQYDKALMEGRVR